MSDQLGAIAEGLAAHPTAWLLAISLLALGYLYRERAQSQKDLLESVVSREAAHRETLMRVIPIAEKLTESVEILERVTNALLERTK